MHFSFILRVFVPWICTPLSAIPQPEGLEYTWSKDENSKSIWSQKHSVMTNVLTGDYAHSQNVIIVFAKNPSWKNQSHGTEKQKYG